MSNTKLALTIILPQETKYPSMVKQISIDLISLAPHHSGLEEAIQLAYRTSVVLLQVPFCALFQALPPPYGLNMCWFDLNPFLKNDFFLGAMALPRYTKYCGLTDYCKWSCSVDK